MTIFPLRRSSSDQAVKTEIITFLRARGIAAWRVNLENLHIQGFMPAPDCRAFGIEVRRPGAMPMLRDDQRDWAATYGQAKAVHIVATSVHDVRMAITSAAVAQIPSRFRAERVAVAPT